MRRPLAILRTLPPEARLEAVAQTIAVASDTERDHLAVELIELVSSLQRPASSPDDRLLRGVVFWAKSRPENGAELAKAALLHLARVWTCLSADARATALLVGRGFWRDAVESASRHPSPRARESAASLVADLADPSLGDVLAHLVTDPLESVSNAAQASLVLLARRAVEQSPSRGIGPLGDVVAELLRTYDRHRKRGVLLAAAWLLDPLAVSDAAPSKALRDWLADPDDPAHLAFRSLIRRAPEGFLLNRAWGWLAVPAVARPSLERVAAVKPDDLPQLLERSHLAARPQRASLLRSLRPRRRSSGNEPAAESLIPPDPTRLSPNARRGVPRLLVALNLADALRDGALSPLLADPEPSVRHAASRVVSGGVLLDFAFDADETVARHAVLRLVGERDAAAASLPNLARSPHASIRRLASEELEDTDPWRPGSARSRLAARRLLASDRAGFLRRLRERIAAGAAAERTSTIMLARALGLASAVELELLATLREIDRTPDDEALVHPAATAVAALGGVSTDSARAAVLACLGHPHDRVRANAVEAVGRLFPPGTPAVADQLRELKNDPHHRVRANTLRLLLAAESPEDRGHVLAEMLGDERPMHRVAGLWLLERELAAPVDAPAARRWSALAARVAEIARTDPDPAAMARAVGLSRRLVGQIRVGWRGRAPSLAPAQRGGGAP